MRVFGHNVGIHFRFLFYQKLLSAVKQELLQAVQKTPVKEKLITLQTGVVLGHLVFSKKRKVSTF